MNTHSHLSELNLLFARLVEALQARAPRRAAEVLLLLLAGVVMMMLGVFARVIRVTLGALIVLVMAGLLVRLTGRVIRSMPFGRR